MEHLSRNSFDNLSKILRLLAIVCTAQEPCHDQGEREYPVGIWKPGSSMASDFDPPLMKILREDQEYRVIGSDFLSEFLQSVSDMPVLVCVRLDN